MNRNHLYTAVTLWAVLAIFTFGCSGKSPVTPGSPGNESLKIPSDSRNGTDRYLWGFWQIEIDPSTLGVSISENRSAQFNANVTRFLQPPVSPTNMLTVKIDTADSDVAHDLLAIDITIKHPFVGVNKFRGFDVRGIFMSDGSVASLHDPSAVYPAWYIASPGHPTSEPVLLNADGYTRWWNSSEFTSYGKIFGYTHGNFSPADYFASATVNGYKYFADGLGATDPFVVDPATRGAFSLSPGLNTRQYMIQFAGKPWKYNYAIDASWALPDPSGAPDYPVDSFPPAANCQEPYQVSLADAGSDAWYGGGFGGFFKINIEIFDWQADTSVNPSAVLDELSAIWVESPAFNDHIGNHYINILARHFELLPGSNRTSSIFHTEIEGDWNSGIQSPGNYPVLLVAESANPNTYEPQIGGGGSQFAFPSAPLAAYAVGLVTVLDTNPYARPEIALIDPDKGAVDTVIPAVEVHGQNFASGATVEFLHESGTYSIGPLATTFVDDTFLKFDLDLNGAMTGLYDVKVKNPDNNSGTLSKGFSVLKPTLVLEDEITFPPIYDNYDCFSPAICVETDNDVTIAFEEVNKDEGNSYAVARRSRDDGSTWPDSQTGICSSGVGFVHGDADKIWPSSYGNSYRTLQLMAEPDVWVAGFMGATFNDSSPDPPDAALVSQDISHFTEILQDADKYVYAIGDLNNIIEFKRSEVPEYIQGGPSGTVWQNFPKYTIADPGTISRARSSALFNGTMYLAYYEETNNVIRLAHASSDWQTWDTSDVIYQADSVNYAGPRDPGLQVDDSGFYCTFVRLPTNVDHDELCFTYSKDGSEWSEPVAIHQGGDVFPILDTPVIHYMWNGISVVGTTWWEGMQIWTSYSIDNGKTWSEPAQVSEKSAQNKQSDLAIAPSGNWHFTFAGLSEGSGLNEIHYRRGHMELK